MPLTEGQTVTLTNYRFNSEHLNACEMKCKLKMSGSRGPVIAVFFKEAFGAQFQGREAGVTVSGIIKRDQASGGLQILVQSVR
jgi:3-phosphoglycerate kinase